MKILLAIVCIVAIAVALAPHILWILSFLAALWIILAVINAVLSVIGRL